MTPPGTSAGIAGFPHGCRKPDSPKQVGEARVGSQAVERRMSPNAVRVNHAGDANQSPIISPRRAMSTRKPARSL